MRQFLLGLSFAVVFIVGCAVGTMQGSQVAEAQMEDPGALAEARSGITRWEYHCERVTGVTPQKFSELADSLGADGWEALGNPDASWCFKRPLR